jgi:hypothetical protein
MPDGERWSLDGDWFDVCKCEIPCPCHFGRAPTYGDCLGVLAWHIMDGHYADVRLDGLNFVMLGYFKGSIWEGPTNAAAATFMDERADQRQREAMQAIFGGRAGGPPAEFMRLLGQAEFRGTEFVPIRFERAKDLAYWSVEVPGKVAAKVEALTGPMVPPGKRIQTTNAPEAMIFTRGASGPGDVSTWGTPVQAEADAFEFRWNLVGKSSKHVPFHWNGP